MGRRKPAAAFSLFSFQDIVTSVTAILILVMLLLSIELISRRRENAVGNPSAPRRHLQETAKRLESVVASLREEVTARRSRRPVRSREEATRELARAREERDAAIRRLEETRRTLDAVTRRHAEAELLSVANEVDRDMLGRLERKIKEDVAAAERLAVENEEERDRQVKRRREIAGSPRSGTELVYNPQANSDRRAWLVELSGNGVAVVLLGGDRNEKLGDSTDAGGRIAKWIGELTSNGDYCLLLQRPSASVALESNVQRRLKDGRIPFGLDFIGEDQAVRDGSTAVR